MAPAAGVDTTDGTDPGNPGGPYLGEYNATIGALRTAGLPAGNILQIANAADATARAGTYDVFVFPETELCDLTAASYLAPVTNLINAGGRVVVTFGGEASFVAGLGLFGTVAGASVATTFAAVADPFWTGIVHPGYLNATFGWSWSGAGLVPLGRDSGGAGPELTVFGYNVP